MAPVVLPHHTTHLQVTTATFSHRCYQGDAVLPVWHLVYGDCVRRSVSPQPTTNEAVTLAPVYVTVFFSPLCCLCISKENIHEARLMCFFFASKRKDPGWKHRTCNGGNLGPSPVQSKNSPLSTEVTTYIRGNVRPKTSQLHQGLKVPDTSTFCLCPVLVHNTVCNWGFYIVDARLSF